MLARLVLGWVCVGVQLLVMESYLGLNNRPGQPSLVVPLWVGGMSTGSREETASSV